MRRAMLAPRALVQRCLPRCPGANARGISFALDPAQEGLQAKVSAFVRDEVIPMEADPRRTSHGPTEDLRRDLVDLARNAGVLSGLSDMHDALRSHVTRAIVFEAAGYSMLGPIAMNIAAPDEVRNEHTRSRSHRLLLD